MNLYLLTISEDDVDWRDFYYDSAVVAAPSEEAARHMHPGSVREEFTYTWDSSYDDYDTWFIVAVDGSLVEDGTVKWPSPHGVEVRRLGQADPGVGPGVIVASLVGE